MAAAVPSELDRRVFGTPDPLPPLQRPGVEGRAEGAITAMRDQGTGLSPIPTGAPLLDEREMPRARALARVLAQLIQNTNITAALPAHVSPPLWSEPVDLVQRVTVPAAVGQYVPVIRYQAPPGRWARIASYGVNVLDPAYTYDGSILWRIRVNGNDVPTLADWGDQRGSIIQPRQTFIVLREDWQVTFEVKRAVAAVLPQDVVMALSGWAWRYRFNYEGTKASLTAQ
jgi:hypothetical protein